MVLLPLLPGVYRAYCEFVILWYYPAAVLMVFSHTFTHELLCAHTLHKFTGVSVADSIVN